MVDFDMTSMRSAEDGIEKGDETEGKAARAGNASGATTARAP